MDEELAEMINEEFVAEMERIILDNEMKRLEQTVPEFPC